MKCDLLDVPGIGPASKKRLEVLGIRTVRDLLWHFPRTYLHRRVRPVAELREEEQWVTVRGMITFVRTRSTRRRGLKIIEACLEDDTGSIDLVWFLHIGKYRGLGRLPVSEGQQVIASGTLRRANARFQLHNILLETNNLSADLPPWPVYKLTKGITDQSLKRWILWALDNHLPQEWIDSSFLQNRGLIPLPEAFRGLHIPRRTEEIGRARRRMALEELYRFTAIAIRKRRGANRQDAPVCRSDSGLRNEFFDGLPFPPTRGQQNAIATVAGELNRSQSMRRLLLGDVGSGKTVVAAYAALHAAKGGFQSMVMAPTRILAEQHAHTLKKLLDPWNVEVELLTTSISARERARLVTKLQDGQPMAVVGTSALLSKDVQFSRLALVIVDEEHRFGVAQREKLVQEHPVHFLAMSATPIPRTLASTFYVDLDVTFLTDKPAGRQKIDTRWIHPEKRNDLYAFVRREVERGRQAYVIFPRVDDTDGEIRAVSEEYTRLANNELAGLKVGMLHGKQSVSDQEKSMEDFVKGLTDVLVATTVVEVGVDVPNATVMVIEHADQFGLAQLHQLRGRVGRGEEQSYCLLVADPTTKHAALRIQALRRHDDGFKIAELDMKLRGPGELFGLRQSGHWEFKVVDPVRDRKMFSLARELACKGTDLQ